RHKEMVGAQIAQGERKLVQPKLAGALARHGVVHAPVFPLGRTRKCAGSRVKRALHRRICALHECRRAIYAIKTGEVTIAIGVIATLKVQDGKGAELEEG